MKRNMQPIVTPKEKDVTIYDIAKRLNISIATVSRAIIAGCNGSDMIDKEPAQ